jgi:RND family efflux transporter MFP subunit
VSVPALEDARLEATVEYVGREVSAETNAVPIVGRIDDSHGRLRPGLFVRVTLPLRDKSNVLSVPEQAVLQHEGQSFVFIAQTANQFRRVDVITGDSRGGDTEVVSGLGAGDRVVTRGAFFLKSELLLESTEE